MPVVELVYERSCPNVTVARSHLVRGFALARMAPSWIEHQIGEPAIPRHARGYGSPTILVDGRDVSGASPGLAGSEACCRLYETEEGQIARVPSITQIGEALTRGRPGRPGLVRWIGWRSSLAVLPGVGSALLPKLACPACWPAYAGLLSSAGLGLLIETRWLLPLTALFLVLAVAALAFRARSRRGPGPFALGLVASVVVLLGKFAYESDAATFSGVGLLVAASLWNAWPRPPLRCAACPGQAHDVS